MSDSGDYQSPIDSITETTHQSWLSRLGQSIMGVLIGFGLIVGATILIFWNEGRAVQTARSLTEGEGLVIAAEQAKVDPANEGKLVHISGDLATKLPLTDPEFGISTSAARLVRTVEVYQWKEDSRTETRKNLGGSEDKVTTYTYTQVWSEPRIDSGRFHEPGGHENPQLRYRRLEVAARDATLGAFRPGEAVLRRLATDEDYRIDPATAGTLRDRFGQATVADGRIYVGLDPARPRLGDTRVSYRIASVGPVSLIGRRLLTWILRGVGSVLMLVGFALIGGPLSVVGSIVPFIGDVLAAGVGLVALLMTAIVVPLVIAIAWFWYRPLVSIAVLAVGFGIVTLLKMGAGRRTAAKATQPA